MKLNKLHFLYIKVIKIHTNKGDIMNFDLGELLNVTLRAISSLITLFLITKILGKKQISQMSVFDYVIGISIGNFAAEMTINLESNEINGIWAVILFGMFAYLVSYLTMKSIVLRRFFMGTPTMIIQNGKILEKNLKKVKLDINDMLEEIRVSGYFDLSQVDYALMEANGKLSILPKKEFRPLTPKDMKIKVQNETLCSNIIIDGKIMYNNLYILNKNEEWLIKQLKIKGFKINDILLATLDLDDKLTIYERNINEKALNVLE